MWDKIAKGLCAAGGAVLGWFGGWNTMLTILSTVMIIDYVTGLIVAACGRSPKTDGGGLSSKVGFIGLAKKGLIFIIVLLATLLDKSTGSGKFVFQSAAALYYIGNEGLSILENAALMGVPFPKKVKTMLEELKGRADEDKNEDKDENKG